MLRLLLFFPVLLLALPASGKPLALAYSIPPGSGTLEDFDAMGPDGARAPGALQETRKGEAWDSYWSVEVGGVKPRQRYDALLLPEDGGSGGYNGGLLGAVDRALGVYSEVNSSRRLEVRFQNDTGASLAGFELVFDVEFWTQGPAQTWGGLQAFVSVDGATYQELDDDFEAVRVSPDDSVGVTWVDGNAPDQADRGMGGVVNLADLGLEPVAPGASFYVRFDAQKGLRIPAELEAALGRKAAREQNRQLAVFVDDLWVGVASPASGLEGTPGSRSGGGTLPPVPSLGGTGLGLLAFALGASAAPLTRRRRV